MLQTGPEIHCDRADLDLGDDVLRSGSSVRINIDDGTGACIYDFKAVFSNGNEATRGKINVCEIGEYTYTD